MNSWLNNLCLSKTFNLKTKKKKFQKALSVIVIINCAFFLYFNLEPFRSDPYHLAGSGSTPWNHETDPVWIRVADKKSATFIWISYNLISLRKNGEKKLEFSSILGRGRIQSRIKIKMILIHNTDWRNFFVQIYL